MKENITVIVDNLSSSLAIWTAYKKHILFISENFNVTLFVQKGYLKDVKEQFSGSPVIVIFFSNYYSLIYNLFKYGSKKIYLPHILIVTKLAWLKLFRFNLFLWLQGILPEESYLRNNSNIRYNVISCVEQFALKRLSGIVLVSHEMKKYLIKKYGYNNENNFILPCMSDLKVMKSIVRNPISFVYVGGASEWQKIDMIIDAYKHIKKEYSSATLDFITRDKDKITEKFILSGNSELMNSVKIYSISDRIEMSKALSQYTYGFLFRDDIAVNKVASPIKFLEYLSCGVSPIMSECIGDYSAFAKKENVGIVLSELNYENLLNDIKNFHPNEEKCIKSHDQFCSQIKPADSFKNLFSKLEF